MTDAQKLASALTADAIATAVGVDRRTVTNRALAQFPAYWWLAVSQLASERGVECPHSAFAFMRANQPAQPDDEAAA